MKLLAILLALTALHYLPRPKLMQASQYLPRFFNALDHHFNGGRSSHALFIWLLGALLPALLVGVLSFCGQALLELGDTMTRVEQTCGAPTERHEFSAPFYFIDNWGNRRYGGEQVFTEWVYNFGPQRFMMKVRFVGSQITNITQLGYGN